MIRANTIRDQICDLALYQYNKNYVHGSMGPDTFDCAGLVWYIYYYFYQVDIFYGGYGKSTTTKLMTSKYGILTLGNDLSILNKGDIVLFHRQSLKDYEPRVDNKYPGHCGIYIGDNSFIHASGTEKRVVISNFSNEYWVKKLVASKDIVSNLDKKNSVYKTDFFN